jgi:class 3 adenylate cyclase/predicted ATPase
MAIMKRGAAMQQIADWLGKLGMSEYAQRFAESDIDTSVLRDLTDQDLKDLGVSLGHRRKILRAIAELAGAAPTFPQPEFGEAKNRETAERSEPPIPAAAPFAPSAGPTVAGERRYLTVMFCDLVDSTGIASRLDAEEWRDLVGSYLDAASAAVTDMGGHVAKKLGDGLMAIFGYPVAHEDDAERAARAGLAVQRHLNELNRKNAGSGKPDLKARVGIETGPAVVDATGEIYGDVPNIAARLQALAEPNAVVMTARVQRQIAGLFVVEELGSHQLKGVPEPVSLFRLIRPSGGGRRAGQRHLTPLVGRDEEIAMLARRWERAREGDGQLALIVGEPGLGKSRLIEEFHTRLRDTPHTWVEWTCSQLLQNTPLHPITEWGRVRFGGADVPVEQRLADLENTLAQIKLEPADNVAVLAGILDIQLPPERTLALPPEELRRRQLAALTNLVMAGARVQPAVLAVEDLHWADPTTLDVLRGIAERGALAPLFVLMTARPEFRPSWGVRSHHATISLVPLDRRHVGQMVEELAARHALAKELIEGVAERTGGVPLFIEEVTRLLLERGEQGGIPPTLQQSLTARLDRLGRAREVAQIGAVIGRSFSYRLIRALAEMEDAALQGTLERLAEADILLVQGLPPQSEYRFKHALIQDAAYENLLKSRRQALHRRIGEILIEQSAGDASIEPELLARHFSEAGLTESAIEWWGKAGQRAIARSAFAEAAEQIKRALDQVISLPMTPALRREQIKLQVALITPLMYLKGYVAPETKLAVERARLLLEQAEGHGETLEDPLLLFSVLYGFWTASHVDFDGDKMCDLAHEFVTLAEKQGSIAPRMVGHRLMGMALVQTGNLAQGRVHFDRAMALYNPIEHRPLATRFGVDSGVSIYSNRSWALWLLGHPAMALADAKRALQDAREIGQAAEFIYAAVHSAFPLIFSGRFSEAEELLKTAVTEAEEIRADYLKALATMFHGSLLALTGRALDSVNMIMSGLTEVRSTGSTLWVPLYLSSLATAHSESGRFDDASHSIRESLTMLQRTGEKWCEAEVYRIAGDLMLNSHEHDAVKAEEYFGRALAVARQQQAKSWELRAAMSMTRLWRSRGKPQQARELLAPVYDWFTEGFDTLDLREAKALLDELHA